MSLRQQAVKGVVWSVITTWGRQLIGFVVFFLLARLLGPDSFGLIAMASVFLAFVHVFVDQGFVDALIQRHQLEPEHLDTAFWTNLGISSLITIFGISISGVVAYLFHQPQLGPIISWLSLSFLLYGLSSVQEALLRRNFDFKSLAIRSLVTGVAGGVVGVTMAFMGFGVWSLVAQLLTNASVQIVVLWWASDWRPGFKVSASHFRDLFSFGSNVVGMNVLEFFNRRSDDFLIGYFLGPESLGYYSVAYRLMMIGLDLLTNVINQVAIPAFSRLQLEPERLLGAFYSVTELTSIISFPAFFGMAALAPELVQVLFGAKWLTSVPVIQILAFIGVLHSVYHFNGTVIMAMGKPSWKLNLTFVYSITNIIGFIIAVRWGIVAVAASFVICSYLIAPIELWLIKKLIPLNLTTYIRQYIAPLTGSLVMVAMIMGTKYFLRGGASLPILLAICILLGTVTYIGVILLIAPAKTRQILTLVESVAPMKKNQG